MVIYGTLLLSFLLAVLVTCSWCVGCYILFSFYPFYFTLRRVVVTIVDWTGLDEAEVEEIFTFQPQSARLYIPSLIILPCTY